MRRRSIDIAVVLDSRDEIWPSMDLVGEMLLDQWRTAPLEVTALGISLPIPRMARRLFGHGKPAFNVDRAITRYLAYPVRAAAARRPGRFFHVADHSYAQVVHVLPAARTGVYCHDIDAFRAIVAPEMERPDKRSTAHRALAAALLRGLRSAAVIFYSTRAVGNALELHGLGATSRLVHAPYGVSREFGAHAEPADTEDDFLALRGRPFMLHVGSSAPRKRLDVLFETFARLHAKRPELRLVQQGAALSADQRALVEKLGIAHALVQPPKLDRTTLASLYRRAAVVLVTSEAEGFGFPVLEALACGAIVVASDIPPLVEVGGDAALYAPLGDVETWTQIVSGVLDGSATAPPTSRRIERAGCFTWEKHARTILDAYRDLV